MKEHAFNSKYRCNPWRVAEAERQGSHIVLDEDPPVLPMPQISNVPAVAIRDDDPRLQQAVQQARSTFPTFLDAFARRLPDDFFAIKGLFTDDFGKEHLWLRPVIFGDEFITGTLDNLPKVVQTVRLGQTVRILRVNIFDWLYVSQGIRYGAHTVEALQQLEAPSEAA